MSTTLISLIVSIIAAFIYDLLKDAYLKRDNKSSMPRDYYSKESFAAMKKEFYISFFTGIALSLIPDTKYAFINQSINVLTYFSFSISLMGFMCVAEVVNYFFDKYSNK